MSQQENAGPRVLAWPGWWHLNRNAPHDGTLVHRLVEAFHDVKKEIPRLKPFFDSLISKRHG